MVRQGKCRRETRYGGRLRFRRILAAKGRPAGATLAEMAKEQNTAAMPLSQTGEFLQERKGFCGLMEIDARARVAVEWSRESGGGHGFAGAHLRGRRIASLREADGAETAPRKTTKRAGSPWSLAKRG